jgi:hypothetical protein
MAAKVVAAWRDANGIVVQVRDDGAMRSLGFHTSPEAYDSDWYIPPVAEPVVVADAQAEPISVVDPVPQAPPHAWTCRECIVEMRPYPDIYRNLPSATRCGRCGSERP